MTNTTVLWAVIASIAVAIVIIAAIASQRRGRVRSAALRERFGPEYERAVEEFGGPARAERRLEARARRVEHIRIRELERRRPHALRRGLGEHPGAVRRRPGGGRPGSQ